MIKNEIHNLARGIIIQDNHILLVSHPDWDGNTFYLPGGHIEHREAAVLALIRELREEVGYEFGVGRFLGCLEYIFNPTIDITVCHSHEFNFLFLVHSESIQDISPIAQQEAKVKLTWVNMNNLNKINLLPNPLIKLIPKWLKLNLKNSFSSY
ncbi:MutT/nudix family protein [endosymbiont of Acanthamoeba sp. UWC8]|uniref:NUDIX domain-containing protein n=1 Tax=endosymbiont of Acanthamoeba sp. UWC8 TaxID=86106 RepID=UPI0004D1C2A6|nr:NUDIX domain-containing protein [endosymbiont of Acanthamoeba sp. UWC8]AIF80768.1 MutT/nudix family protein [endosymbiont of Acanthamoeba sp. UWC8]